MLNHVDPEEPTREYVYRGRIPGNEEQDRDQEIDAAPEPAIPPVQAGIRTGLSKGSRGPGSILRLFLYVEYPPSTEVQDFGDKTPEQYGGWEWPPIGINPDGHCSTSPYQQYALRNQQSEQPYDQARNHRVVPPVASNLGDVLMPGNPA